MIAIFKLFIVDDEEIEREGISSICNWQELGIELIGEAWNGKIALQLLETVEPDIIITDVKMPVMNGIEFAAKIKERYPKVKVIFISGYEDFTAAKSAIEMNAFAYLLKPVYINELLNTIKKALNFFIDEKVKLQEDLYVIKQLEESLPLLKEKLLRELLLATTVQDKKRCFDKAQYLGIRLASGQYSVLVVKIDGFLYFCNTQNEEAIYSLLIKVKRAIDDALVPKSNLLSFATHEGEFALINSFSTILGDDEIVQYMEKLGEDIIKQVDNAYNAKVTIGISTTKTDIDNLPLQYYQAQIAVDSKFYLGSNRVLWYEDNNEKNQNILLNIRKVTESLNDAILANDTQGTRTIIDEFFSQLMDKNNFDKQYIQSVCMEIISFAVRILAEANESIENVFGKGKSPWAKLLQFETILDIKNFMTNCLTAITDYLYQQRQDRSQNLVHKIKEIINIQYKSIISIEDIAGQVFMASGYIRRVFKNKTGQTIQDYLINYRLKKAAELLLNTSSKVSEVAEMVGYENPSYFCTVFKDFYGITPGEYKYGNKKAQKKDDKNTSQANQYNK